MPEPNDDKSMFGFTRRAIISEWIKYSTHLNLQDEVIRSSLVSFLLEIVGNIEFSYDDYEFMLGEHRQLINN